MSSPIIAEYRTCISVAPVGDHGQEVCAAALAVGDLCRRPDRGPGGNSHEESFGFRETSAHFKGIFLIDRNNVVINTSIKDARHESGTVSFDTMFPWLPTGEDGRSFRFNRINLDRGEASPDPPCPHP